MQVCKALEMQTVTSGHALIEWKHFTLILHWSSIHWLSLTIQNIVRIFGRVSQYTELSMLWYAAAIVVDYQY